MRPFVLVNQAKRLTLIQAAHVVQSQVGNDISHVSLELLALSILDHVRIEIEPLPRQNAGIVEAPGIVRQMPFAYNAGLIACLLQELREGRQLRIQPLDTVFGLELPRMPFTLESVPVRMLARAGRKANWCRRRF